MKYYHKLRVHRWPDGAGGRWQAAGGRRQAVGGRRQSAGFSEGAPGMGRWARECGTQAWCVVT